MEDKIILTYLLIPTFFYMILQGVSFVSVLNYLKKRHYNVYHKYVSVDWPPWTLIFLFEGGRETKIILKLMYSNELILDDILRKKIRLLRIVSYSGLPFMILFLIYSIKFLF